MKSLRTLPSYVVLLIITLAAGLILGGVYTLTEGTINERQLLEAENTRSRVLGTAESFEQLEAGDAVDWLYAGKDAEGHVVGYVGQVTVQGYKAEIEVITGIDLDGSITGISVGGSNFSETVGLGAKTKDADFTERFKGLGTPITILNTGDTADSNGVDSVTGATISSKAVASAVNRFGEYINAAFGSGTKAGEGE